MEEFNEELKRVYFNALYNQQNGNNELMLLFKEQHQELFAVVNAMYHRRKTIRENVYCMRKIAKENYLVFGDLTYDNEHDKESEPTKRKQGVRYLNKCLDAYLFVEEHGNEKERYHIHFIGILKDNLVYKSFLDGWHSFAHIQKVISVKNSVNYLTDYVVKQVPRIRRNKKLVAAFKHYQKSLSWSRYGFENSFAKEEIDNAVKLVFEGL